MDLELFPLLLGMAIGGLLGRKGKDIVKPIAKSVMTLREKSREWGANLREDMRDAIEEAKYEREQESLMQEEPPAPAAPRVRRTRAKAPAAEEKPARRTGTRKPRAEATATPTRRGPRRSTRAAAEGGVAAPRSEEGRQAEQPAG